MSKMSCDSDPEVLDTGRKDIMYDRGTIKVVVFACFIIVLSVVLTGAISYYITRNAVVEKLKSRDLVYIVESMSAKIDGRIDRAKETSLILAQDPTVIQWIAGAETDERLGAYSTTKMNDIAQRYDYANAFIVSAVTNHYWAEGPKVIQTMSETSPDDNWFYAALKSGQPVDLNIDYNSGRKDTFVFINALVGDVSHPVAVAGVGLSLKEIANEFQNYKFGQNSNLWLVDRKGKIHLSDDINQNGKYLNDFLPADIVSQILQDLDNAATKPKVIEYADTHGQTVDLAYQATKSSDWKLVFQIPRDESIALLGNIKLNTAIAGLVSLILIVFVFYIVSQRIANPLKRALALTQEMEKQVGERTRELADKNQKIMDSIDYAKRLQESILPSEEELSAILREHFVLWRPRDTVGGDFYWVRRIDDDRSLLAVVDCTGHGVPGAFMTMAVNSILNHIVDHNHEDPAQIVAELNRRVKETLHRNDPGRVADDGLDIGLCYIEKNHRLTFAGAKIPLYIQQGQNVHVIRGDKRSIGYRRSSRELEFTNHVWDIAAGDMFYLTTDGYIDQSGGDQNFPFGRKRFVQVLAEQTAEDISQRQETLERALGKYMGDESQRDDITVIGFSF